MGAHDRSMTAQAVKDEVLLVLGSICSVGKFEEMCVALVIPDNNVCDSA